ncbi:MAG: glycerate kinase [Eggerthellaceae bacterium]|nr:glycerate kinase [Eggerthellaceae bacterium]
MKLVFASDTFKGSLSSVKIGELLETAAHEVFPDAECITFPIADGGEGTLDAIEHVRPGERAAFESHDGLMRPVETSVFLCGESAFVEAAATCGLTMLDMGERNPLNTSSYGVGESICFALDKGYESISIGLGGSCTNNGGMGCLRALGVRFYDDEGRELGGCGADLERVARIDESGLHNCVHDVGFTIMSDVNNPLLGPNGATYVFGRQKGAGDRALARLELGMRHYAETIAETHPDVDFDTAGFGAAGGLGMALAVFLGAQMRSGIEELLYWFDFDATIDGADLVVTGEGKLDSQSLDGKVVSGVIAHAGRQGVPAAVICGKLDLDEQQLCNMDLAYVLETGKGQTLEHAMAHAEENYLRSARELFANLRSAR